MLAKIDILLYFIIPYHITVLTILKLHEDNVSLFPPSCYRSYPYSEAIENGSKYMKTRVPAWCDRIFLSLPAKTILSEVKSQVVI